MEGQRIFTYPNAVVRVHFPDLTEEENRKRMQEIRKVAEEILKERIRNETHK